MTLVEAMVEVFQTRWPEFDRAVGEPVTLGCNIGGDEAQYVISTQLGRAVARFKMRASLQCSGIAVPYNTFVEPEYRNRGLGRQLHNLRVEAALRAGFGMLIATTRQDNFNQNQIMNRFAWTQIAAFTNPRTMNPVFVWMKTL